MTAFAPLASAFADHGVRYVLIGVWGANFHAHAGGVVFHTVDRDVFLPLEAENLVAAWRACEACGLPLSAAGEPLDQPRDLRLAERAVERRAMTQAIRDDFQVDLALVMAGFEFDEVWEQRRVFAVEGVEIPVARLRHIVDSKAAIGRDKDQLFLATHEENLRQLLVPEDAMGETEAGAAEEQGRRSSRSVTHGSSRFGVACALRPVRKEVPCA